MNTWMVSKNVRFWGSKSMDDPLILLVSLLAFFEKWAMLLSLDYKQHCHEEKIIILPLFLDFTFILLSFFSTQKKRNLAKIDF